MIPVLLDDFEGFKILVELVDVVEVVRKIEVELKDVIDLLQSHNKTSMNE